MKFEDDQDEPELAGIRALFGRLTTGALPVCLSLLSGGAVLGGAKTDVPLPAMVLTWCLFSITATAAGVAALRVLYAQVEALAEDWSLRHERRAFRRERARRGWSQSLREEGPDLGGK